MTARVIHGDCLDAMRAMDADSIDAIVTDPPYGLEFMGKEWDAPWKHGFSSPGYGDAERLARPSFTSSRNPICLSCGKRQRTWEGGPAKCSCPAPKWDRKQADESRAFQAWSEEWAREALRIAKPGAHLVAFGGTRMYHRLACAIEDAGWEVRDCLSWLYGSGFPKSLDVSRAIDKAAGAERSIVVGTRGLSKWSNGAAAGVAIKDDGGLRQDFDKVNTLLAPATDAARQWQGWGTALKPAWEPIILARKPLVGTVAANVITHGTGAINVDACRIGTAFAENFVRPVTHNGEHEGWRRPWKDTEDGRNRREASKAVAAEKAAALGRWPANVALDEEAAAMLDAQTGTLTSGSGIKGKRSHVNTYGKPTQDLITDWTGDSGGASRFFYTAKASRSERNAGCDGIEARPQDPTRDVDAPGGNNPRNRGAAPRVNSHPTVKPVALMRWLVRMVTPPAGVVLDPFCGSGTTLVAAIEEGFDCIGIEREAEYVAIIEARVAAAQQAPQRVAKPKPKRQPVKVQPAAKASPMPSVEAPLPGQLALAWDAR